MCFSVLALIISFVSTNAVTEQQCCNLQSTEDIDYLRNSVVHGNRSSNDYDDNDDSGNNGSIRGTDEYGLIKCKAQCDAQWKTDFHVCVICSNFC